MLVAGGSVGAVAAVSSQLELAHPSGVGEEVVVLVLPVADETKVSLRKGDFLASVNGNVFTAAVLEEAAATGKDIDKIRAFRNQS